MAYLPPLLALLLADQHLHRQPDPRRSRLSLPFQPSPVCGGYLGKLGSAFLSWTVLSVLYSNPNGTIALVSRHPDFRVCPISSPLIPLCPPPLSLLLLPLSSYISRILLLASLIHRAGIACKIILSCLIHPSNFHSATDLDFALTLLSHKSERTRPLFVSTALSHSALSVCLFLD